jgi:hypothetical protein
MIASSSPWTIFANVERSPFSPPEIVSELITWTRHMISACLYEHQHCVKGNENSDFLPTRVLGVDLEEANLDNVKVKVIQANSRPRGTATYLTLSTAGARHHM